MSVKRIYQKTCDKCGCIVAGDGYSKDGPTHFTFKGTQYVNIQEYNSAVQPFDLCQDCHWLLCDWLKQIT